MSRILPLVPRSFLPPDCAPGGPDSEIDVTPRPEGGSEGVTSELVLWGAPPVGGHTLTYVCVF